MNILDRTKRIVPFCVVIFLLGACEFISNDEPPKATANKKQGSVETSPPSPGHLQADGDEFSISGGPAPDQSPQMESQSGNWSMKMTPTPNQSK
jgi:hypothetical protein